MLVRTLLLLIQAMYLAFYLGALANLAEISDIFAEARLLSPATLTVLLVTTAVVMILMRQISEFLSCARVSFSLPSSRIIRTASAGPNPAL